MLSKVGKGKVDEHHLTFPIRLPPVSITEYPIDDCTIEIASAYIILTTNVISLLHPLGYVLI